MMNTEEISNVTCYCPFCSNVSTILVDTADYNAWRAGKLAQRAFPYLSAEDRETLISGLCPDCQESFFEEDEEE